MTGTDNVLITDEKRKRRLEERAKREEANQAEKEKERAARELAYLEKKWAAETRQEAEAKETVEAIQKIEIEAGRILQIGDPFDYFLKTFQLDHEGDLTAARAMALVFAAGSVANGDGLHCYLSGNSGKGKSHAAETMFRQLPAEYRFNRSFSDRYLFYAGSDPGSGLKPGVVALIDDQTMSDAVQELFKVSVSHYRDGTDYGTVVNQKPHTLKMPARISWVLLKVDDPGDDQVMNRLIQARIQETDEKIRDSAKKIQEKYRDLKKKCIGTDRREIMICRDMWSKIKSESVAVEVPCAGHVEFADYGNLRNHELFFNTLMAHAVIHRWQRETIGKTEDGIPIIRATEADYKEAKLIFESLHTFGGQRHNTLNNEDQVIDALIKMNPEKGIFTIREVAGGSGLNYKAAYRAVNGREGGKGGEKLGGLLEKCPHIRKGGKRCQYELETETRIINGKYSHGEITRKESKNEDVYEVDIGALTAWNTTGDIIWLVTGFKWESDST